MVGKDGGYGGEEAACSSLRVVPIVRVNDVGFISDVDGVLKRRSRRFVEKFREEVIPVVALDGLVKAIEVIEYDGWNCLSVSLTAQKYGVIPA